MLCQPDQYTPLDGGSISPRLTLPGLVLRLEGDEKALTDALNGFNHIQRSTKCVPERPPEWTIIWDRSANPSPFRGGRPIRIGRSTGAQPLNWLVSGCRRTFWNPVDSTQVRVEPASRCLRVTGCESPPRFGFTVDQSAKCLLRGALLHDGWELYHAASVTLEDKVVVIVGPKGSGKTTLQLALLELGARFFSADRTFVSGHHDEMAALPWPGAARLDARTCTLFGNLLRALDEGLLRTSPAAPRARVPFSRMLLTFGPLALDARVRVTVLLEPTEGKAGGRMTVLTPAAARKSLRPHLLTDVSDPRPDWLGTTEWWPRRAARVSLSRQPVLHLRGRSGGARQTALEVLRAVTDLA